MNTQSNISADYSAAATGSGVLTKESYPDVRTKRNQSGMGERSFRTMLMDFQLRKARFIFLLVIIIACNQSQTERFDYFESSHVIKNVDTLIYKYRLGKRISYDTLIFNSTDSNLFKDVLYHFLKIKNPSFELKRFLSNPKKISDSLVYFHSVESPYVCIYSYSLLGPVYIKNTEVPNCEHFLIKHSRYPESFIDSIVKLSRNNYNQRRKKLFPQYH